MVQIMEWLAQLSSTLPILKTVGIAMVIFIVFKIVIRIIKKSLLKHAHTKKQKSNTEIFSNILNYVLVIFVLLFIFFSYSGSWTGLGIGVGLLSAALGWALQRPITGLAAWIMIITKRPFDIGDRIIIGSVRGDVVDITLTHIYIDEIGGIVTGEERSGRAIMIPNSILFEQNITNYTLGGDYTLDQVVTSVTYESNLDHAIKLVMKAALKHLKEFSENVKTKPYIRTYFQPSGIGVHMRYFAPATHIQEISSAITKEIFDEFSKAKDVEIAYPHTEIVIKERKHKI